MTEKLRDKLAGSPFQSKEAIILDAREKASRFVQGFRKESKAEQKERREEMRYGLRNRTKVGSQSLSSSQVRQTLKTFNRLRKENAGQADGKRGGSIETNPKETEADADLQDQVISLLLDEKQKRRATKLKAVHMKDPQSYEKARGETKATRDMLDGIKQRVIIGKKREDQKQAAAVASGIPPLRVNNASYLGISHQPSEMSELFNIGTKKVPGAPEQATKSERARQYAEDMRELDPAYQRHSKALSTFILQNTLKYTNEHIYNKAGYYEKKHNMERREFIKIYNLFVSLSFITIKNSLQRNKEDASQKGAGKKTRNLQDFSKVSIDGAGIDLKTLMNDGFPQLKFENAMVIEKLFENIRKEMDTRTKRVTFDSFLGLVKSFMTTDIDVKVNRFFQLIDEDGNGELSIDEILNLCQRSF